MPTLQLSISSKLTNIALVDNCIRAVCHLIHLNDQLVFSIQLAVTEWLNNVIIHAYQQQDGQRIVLNLYLKPNCVEIEVQDSGLSLPPDYLASRQCLPAIKPSPDDLDSLPEGGWGLPLINTLMDKVCYNSKRGRNSLRMRKYYSFNEII